MVRHPKACRTYFVTLTSLAFDRKKLLSPFLPCRFKYGHTNFHDRVLHMPLTVIKNSEQRQIYSNTVCSFYLISQPGKLGGGEAGAAVHWVLDKWPANGPAQEVFFFGRWVHMMSVAAARRRSSSSAGGCT